MEENPQGPARAWRLLAGLQAGMVAGLIMSAYLLFENVRLGQSPWQAPNLFAGTLLGPRGFRPQFGAATLVGYSLLFLLSGVQGLLFGLLVPPRMGALWSANIGILYGLTWYALVFRGLLAASNPLLLTPASRVSMLLAHFVCGAALGFYPRFHREVTKAL